MTDEYDECITRLENLPTTVRAYTYHDDDGRCYILLNARLTHEQNCRSYEHELRHIARGDLWNQDYHEYERSDPA